MGTRWFGEPAGAAQPGATLPRLVEAVSRLLDGSPSPPVAPGSGLVDAAASAVVLPSASLPGCSLVVQVAEWSSSVGCWWTLGDDPRPGPLAAELFAEFPLRPDGVDRAVAWLGRELRRPVLEQEQGYGMLRRRRWSLVLDDGRELAVRGRWLLGWTEPGEGRTAAGAGRDPVPGSRLLVAGVGAAAAGWALGAATPALFWASWVWGAVRVLDVAAFALLLAWFRMAGSGRPAGVRLPMLAGLGLATLGQAAELLTGPAGAPSPEDPAGRAFALALRGLLPSLLATAALACWLAAVLGLPRWRRVPAWLSVAAGAGWTLDIAVGLGWLLASGRDRPSEALAWYDAPAVGLREAALAVAVLLLPAVAERRPPAARAGLAGAVLLVAASSFAVQAGVSALVERLPQPLGFAVAGVVPLAAWFAGAALLAVAAAHPTPQVPGEDDASPGAGETTVARPSRGE
jgi:hypothetical protein